MVNNKSKPTLQKKESEEIEGLLEAFSLNQ